MQKLSRQIFKPSSIGNLLGNKSSHQMMMNKTIMMNISQRFFSSSLLNRNNTEGGISASAATPIVQQQTTTDAASSTLNTSSAVPQKKGFDEPLHEQQSFDLDDFEDEVAGQQLEAAESISDIFSSLT